MQRPRPERKDSAVRSRSDASTSYVDVIVLTADPALLATLREAAGPAHQLFHAESPESAVDLLIGGRCGIFIVDITVVRGHAVELFDRLHAQFPEVVLLATGRRDEQNAVAGLVGSGRIYRFLHKPVSPARAELFLSAATRRYGDMHPHESRPRLALGPLRASRNRVAFVSVATAAIAIGVGYWGWTNLEQLGARAPAGARQATPAASADEWAKRADAAFALGNFVAPANENALELYRAALTVDPSNAAAHSGLAKLATLYEQRTSKALDARDLPHARDALASLQRVAPEHPRLSALQSSLASLAHRASATPTATAPARSVTSAPRPVPSDSPSSSPTPNVDVARAFLAADQLFEPADASALGALRQARAGAEDETAIQIAATDLGTRILKRALVAAEANDASAAQSALDVAIAIDREFETALPDVDRIATRIADLRNASQRATRQSVLERATRLRLSGQLIEPQGENAVEALQAALAGDPTSEDVKNEQQHLSLALLESTRTALAAGDIDRADVLATRAEEVLPGLPQTRALRTQIGTARAQREANTVLQAASLPRRREVPAVYPREALLSATQGWVEMEFVISVEGVPSEIRVKASQPPRTFDLAAVQALRQWRFEPILSDGTPRARRARLRMEFKLKS